MGNTEREIRALGWMMIEQLPAEPCRICADRRALCGQRPGRADDEFRSPLCYVHSKIFITDRTWQSADSGIRDSIFNRCNDATVRTREVPLVHSSITYTQSLHAINSLPAVGWVGNLLCGRHRLIMETCKNFIIHFCKLFLNISVYKIRIA